MRWLGALKKKRNFVWNFCFFFFIWGFLTKFYFKNLKTFYFIQSKDFIHFIITREVQQQQTRQLRRIKQHF
jgi:hypothetical protein